MPHRDRDHEHDPGPGPDPGPREDHRVWLTFVALLAFAACIMILFGSIVLVLWRRHEAGLG